MIIPSYGVTATERVLPRLALDFTTASLDSRVTVSRALNTATRINSSGFIETVNADLPRFDFSPTSIGTCQGLLIEESRTNIAPSSESFTSNWASLNATVSAAAGTSPTGANNAVKLVTANSTTFQIRYWGPTLTSGVTYVASVFAKAGEITRIGLGSANTGQVPQGNFNLTTLTATGVAGSTAFIVPYPNNWYRCIAIRTATATGGDLASVALQDASGNINFAGNGSDGAYIWGYDFQVGSFATSYIPNTGTGTTTRNADVVTMTGTNFSDWYNTSEGTMVFDYNIPSNVTLPVLGGIGQNTFNTTARFNVVNAIRANGTSFPNIVTCGTAVTGTGKMAVGLKENDYAAYVNGSLNGADTSGTMIPAASNRFNIGWDETDDNTFLNAHIRKILYYSQRLLNAELAAVSK